VVAVRITARVIDGSGELMMATISVNKSKPRLGSVAAPRCSHATSTATALIELRVHAESLRCHDAESDHPNEHANRMIWCVAVIRSSPAEP